ncbi:hypothetical protein QUW15_13850, partial [Desulfovibrio piger]|nr:hypothetical protein [Desulfovibrio piger]
GGTARPAKSERKTALFPQNDRPYGLKCTAFQTENALSGKSQEYEATPPPKTNGVCTAYLFYVLKLLVKFR